MLSTLLRVRSVGETHEVIGINIRQLSTRCSRKAEWRHFGPSPLWRHRGQRPTAGEQDTRCSPQTSRTDLRTLNRSEFLDSSNKIEFLTIDLKGSWNVLPNEIFHLSAQTWLTSGYGPRLPTVTAPGEHGLLWPQSTSRDSALEDNVHRACFLQTPYIHSDPCTYLQQKLKWRPRTHISLGFTQGSMCMLCNAPWDKALATKELNLF